MAVFAVSVQKRCQGVYWTNRYFVDATDIVSAEGKGLQIVAAERAVTLGYVGFISMRTSVPGPENPNVFMVTPLEGVGSVAADGPIPLTICARALFSKGPTYPDVKYLRGVIDKGDIGSVDSYAPGVITALETGYVAAIIAIPGICSEDGTPYISGEISPKIAQHQLTRGTRKKTTPVIPVA